MIISDPNDFVGEVHDRMLVLLLPDQFEHWLSGNMGVEELKPVANDYLQRWAVSKRVNSSKADKDDASLIEPIKLAALSRRAIFRRTAALPGAPASDTKLHSLNVGQSILLAQPTLSELKACPLRG